jgi:pimeloyl-ACP methyl ester carboxylesterase
MHFIAGNKLATALIVLLALYFLAPLWMNRAELPPDTIQYKCPENKLDPFQDPKKTCRPNSDIKIIRLTNAGEFVNRCELTNALYELNWDRQAPESKYKVCFDESAPRLPKLALLYIHGWKHNADENDEDYKNFRKLIEELRNRHSDQYVVGIYVGWNADSGMGDILDNLSFWVKKNNADRIAQSSVVTLIVSSIGAIIRADPNHRDEFIAVGHSFGARMLYAATAQSLVTATEQAHPGYPGGTYKIVQPLTDAVILLNPAFEASRYSSIDDFTRSDEHFRQTQPPLIVTVSSEADWATKTAFPIGQWLGSARSPRERATLGNYSPFRTHTLTKTAETDCKATYGGFTEKLYRAGLCLQREPQRVSEDGAAALPVQPYNPFVVAQTKSNIISSHADIWNPVFQNWLFELVSAVHVETQNLRMMNLK